PQAAALGVTVDGPGQRALEADEVASTLVGVDVVGEGVDALVVPVIPLHRDLERDAVLLRLEEDRGVQGLLRLVEELDEADDPALELEDVALLAPLVDDADLRPGVEEGELAQPLAEHVELEIGGLEDGGVGLEPHRGPALVGGADLRNLSLGNAAGVALLVDLPVPGNLQTKPLAEGVDHGH